MAAVDALSAQRPTRRHEGQPPGAAAALRRRLKDIREVTLALWEEVREMREELTALRALLLPSQSGEQRADELVGPRQRRDERQAEEQRRTEDGP